MDSKSFKEALADLYNIYNPSKIKEVERIYLGDRIRDIHYIENNNFFLLLFEEQPAIGIFEKF